MKRPNYAMCVGAVLVEATVALPMVLLLVIGFLDFSRIAILRSRSLEAAQFAARTISLTVEQEKSTALLEAHPDVLPEVEDAFRYLGYPRPTKLASRAMITELGCEYRLVSVRIESETVCLICRLLGLTSFSHAQISSQREMRVASAEECSS